MHMLLCVHKCYTHQRSMHKFFNPMNVTSESKNVKLARFISCLFLIILIKPTTKYSVKNIYSARHSYLQEVLICG